mgnify:CR=1 FL=1
MNTIAEYVIAGGFIYLIAQILIIYICFLVFKKIFKLITGCILGIIVVVLTISVFLLAFSI